MYKIQFPESHGAFHWNKLFDCCKIFVSHLCMEDMCMGQNVQLKILYSPKIYIIFIWIWTGHLIMTCYVASQQSQ